MAPMPLPQSLHLLIAVSVVCVACAGARADDNIAKMHVQRADVFHGMRLDPQVHARELDGEPTP